MKIYIYKIDISRFRHTAYLRKFHAILNEADATNNDVSIFAVEAESPQEANAAAQQYIRRLLRQWRNESAIEDATWCLLPLGTVDNIHCDMACEGYGYYYRGTATHGVHFYMDTPVTCAKVTGDQNVYEE